MTNARNIGKSKKHPVTVVGPWFAMPLDFVRSRAWASLSPHAAKMLLDLCAGLGPNAKGNGDLSAAPAVMGPKGWASTATRVAALQELEDASLIVVTRRGDRRKCTLYAVTLWPLHCDFSKLDHGPGCFTTADWQQGRAERAERPTIEAPAKWHAPRKRNLALPAKGKAASDMHPPGDNLKQADRRFVPATGTKAPLLGKRLVPPGDTFLDLPSAGARAGLGVRLGIALADGDRPPTVTYAS